MTDKGALSEESLAGLYRHADRARWLAYRITGCEAAAEEAVQEALLGLVQKAAAFAQ
jgi:DNA-directed RNA polymerase specialized sigma24 family protein